MNRLTALLSSSLALWAVASSAQENAPRSAPAFGSYATPADYPRRVTTSQYVAMRDGVKLAVSITRPADASGKAVDGHFPVIWQATLGIAGPGAEGGPLGIGATPQTRGYAAMPTLANYGYVVVQVARRGNGPSFGVRRAYNDRTEANDAYELMDWMAGQSWSNGNIGMFGCSNTGDAAMHAVTADNPHLKAAWAGCFSWQKYDGFLRGGIMANWGTGPERTVAQDMNSVPVQGDEAKTLLHAAAEEHQASTPLLPMWQGLPYRDSDSPLVQTRFWVEGSVGAYANQINRSGVAIYVQGGWHDDFREQGLITFANLKGERHILIGPWTHCGNDDFDLFAEAHRFFDEHLKGIETGIASDAPIHYFTINAPKGREWRAASQWPLPGTQRRDYFLADGALRPAASDGKPTTFAVRYDVDCPPGKGSPPRPDGLLTGALPCFAETAGPHFVSTVLAADTDVTGSPLADLWIAAGARDQNIFIYLEDVAPDGTITVVTDGRLKASLRKVNTAPFENFGLPWHRAYQEDAQDLVPGEPARLAFEFLPTSYIFKKGHKIRVTIAGADFREKNRTPVAPAPVLTILSDKTHASSVNLPIIPAPL